ncbi:MAG: aldo/keto reductase [Phycisphaerae bacterium]
MNTKTLRWGILSTGRIAGTFATGLKDAQRGRLAAVASRDAAKAAEFAAKHGCDRSFGTYEAMLASDAVDAVYIATPHPQHAEWAIQCAQAGKHVLCEKPIGINAAEAMAIFDAAEAHGVVVLEAFMFRCHPQTARLCDLVKQQAVGRLRHMDIPFSFRAGFNPTARLFAPELAGGGILDVGCYTTSLARLLAGVTQDKPFAEPTKFAGTADIGPSGVDEIATASLQFAGGLTAQLRTGVRLNADNTVRLWGDEGRIEVPSLWIPAREGGTVTIHVHRDGKEREEIAVETTQHLYALEADAFAEAVATGRVPWPMMDAADTLGNLQALDRWRSSIGLTYPAETAAGLPKVSVAGRKVAVGVGAMNDAPMPADTIPGIATPVSRFVMGVDNVAHLPTNRVMYDAYFAAGGNTFDTAHIYGRDRSKVLSQWVANRGVREQVNLICKGCHTPANYPMFVRPQLEEQLRWLETDHCEIYFLHRDNPDVPAGGFVDAMNECVEAGLIRGIFGGSNWSTARVNEANAWAKANNKRPMGGTSNNLSLAHMVDPVWAGCVHVSDAASLAWYHERQMTNFSWSSQARGFFVPGRAAPENLADKELARSWYSPDNFKRLDRAKQLAGEKGVSPINIAAAYVLCQPFTSIALIGPRTLGELRSSLPAVNVQLTAGELKWLSLESDAR